MPPGDREDFIDSSPLAWADLNMFVNENQQTLEFQKHRFLIDPFTDMHPDQVYRKSAQVGMSVTMILKSIWLAKYRRLNLGYVLPTQNVVKDFVTPKVDPLIASNPEIAKLVTKDSVTLKQVGDRFLYFRGAFSEREAIAISLDALILDELDRMPDMSIVNTYDSRMQASDYGYRWSLSNPSVPNYGVDELFLDSNQLHWFVKCGRCNHEWFIDFEQGEVAHFVNAELGIYACGKCGRELTNFDRQHGRWVAKYASRTERHGYWMNQMVAPWVSAKRILQQQKDSTTDFFYNFVLGLPYQAVDLLIDRASILNASKPGEPSLRNVVMGSDIGKPHWYWLATPDGFFRYGHADSWDELERLFNLYQCDAWVMDALPEFTKVQEMLRKYAGKAYACYFNLRDTQGIGLVKWEEGDRVGIVRADRSKLIDRVATEISGKDIRFLMPPDQLEQFIAHAGALYRTVVTDDKGKVVVQWQTKESRPDHSFFALLYCRIALEQAFSGLDSGVVETEAEITGNIAPTVKDGKIEVMFDIEESLERAEQQP